MIEIGPNLMNVIGAIIFGVCVIVWEWSGRRK